MNLGNHLEAPLCGSGDSEETKRKGRLLPPWLHDAWSPDKLLRPGRRVPGARGQSSQAGSPGIAPPRRPPGPTVWSPDPATLLPCGSPCAHAESHLQEGACSTEPAPGTHVQAQPPGAPDGEVRAPVRRADSTRALCLQAGRGRALRGRADRRVPLPGERVHRGGNRGHPLRRCPEIPVVPVSRAATPADAEQGRRARRAPPSAEQKARVPLSYHLPILGEDLNELGGINPRVLRCPYVLKNPRWVLHGWEGFV